MRITRKVFHDLAIWMIAFGLSIGLGFPFFVMLLGVPGETALTPLFLSACLCAGALAGAINFILARAVVGRRMRLLAESMRHVEANVMSMASSADMSQCEPAGCAIEVDSEDEIGESARAFNQLVSTLARTMRTQAAVHSFSEMLTSHLELGSLADQALQEFLKHTRSVGGAVLSETGGELSLVATRGLKDPQSLAARDPVRTAFLSGQPQTIRVPEEVTVDGVLADFRPSEIAVLPCAYKGVPLGIVVLATTERFDSDEHIRMELFRHGLGLALNNALVHDRLQRLAALDPLTGVYNRRFGLGRLHEEFGRAVRGNSPLGVLMLDMDYFKSVNDTYGHLAGDRLLKSVVGITRTILREGDVLLRYGGEEFLAVLPAASAEDLRLIGERLRRSVEDNRLKEGEQTIRVTLSVGGAAYPGQAVEREEELIQLADQALYRAKETGRNRVEIAT